MAARRIPWLSLATDTLRLGLEAQSVVGLRLVRAALGGPLAEAEARRMVSEKAKTAIDAHLLLTRSVLAGEAHLAPARAVALYRRRVQANQRRLFAGR